MNDQPTDEDIRRILDEDDIERLVKGILVTLRDMTDSEHREFFTLAEVYDKMSLYAYHKRVMDLVCKDHLIPHGLVDSHNNQIKITSKGRHRVDQIKNADNILWRETLERLGKLSQLKAFTQPMGSLNSTKELWMESDTDMGKISSILAEDYSKHSFQDAGKNLEKLEHLDIVTTRASDESLKNNTRDFDISKELKKPSVNVLARSRIDLDGDVGLFLPQNEVDFDLKIIALHKENVDIGL